MAAQVPKMWEVPEDLRIKLGDRVGRQRVLSSQGHVVIVLHRAPEPGKPEREGLFLWRKPDGAWEVSERGRASTVLKEHVDTYRKAVDQLEEAFAAASGPEGYYHVLQALSPLSRSCSHMHAVLLQAREVVPDDRELVSVSDWVYEISRAGELLQSDTKGAMDFEIARQAVRQAEKSEQVAQTANRLNGLAAFFFPLTALASIFGMELTSGLDRERPLFFWAVLVLGVLLGALITAAVMRPTRPTRARPSNVEPS